MVHASNFHRFPAMPVELNFFHWLLEVACASFCYLWLTICFYFVAPYEESSSATCESLEQYLQRIHLPRDFTANYLLPLMSSVCTCSHQDLLKFPASDVLDYKRRTHLQPHYVVDDGVQIVQEKLAKGLDVRLGVCLTKLEPSSNGVNIMWLDSDGNERIEVFDFAVLAVSPDVVAAIFEPLKYSLEHVPTTMVETVAHTDISTIPPLHLSRGKDTFLPGASIISATSTQRIHFRSKEGETESVHEQPNSVLVTTNPLTPIDRSKIIRSAKFTRVLRSPESRHLINDIFRGDTHVSEAAFSKTWRNGDGGVYLAGGWCWDGMVLLEGCVVSAMRVASDLGVSWCCRMMVTACISFCNL
jgi:predicted NAD/FAD-binding protein